MSSRGMNVDSLQDNESRNKREKNRPITLKQGIDFFHGRIYDAMEKCLKDKTFLVIFLGNDSYTQLSCTHQDQTKSPVLEDTDSHVRMYDGTNSDNLKSNQLYLRLARENVMLSKDLKGHRKSFSLQNDEKNAEEPLLQQKSPKAYMEDNNADNISSSSRFLDQIRYFNNEHVVKTLENMSPKPIFIVVDSHTLDGAALSTRYSISTLPAIIALSPLVPKKPFNVLVGLQRPKSIIDILETSQRKYELLTYAIEHRKKQTKTPGPTSKQSPQQQRNGEYISPSSESDMGLAPHQTTFSQRNTNTYDPFDRFTIDDSNLLNDYSDSFQSDAITQGSHILDWNRIKSMDSQSQQSNEKSTTKDTREDLVDDSGKHKHPSKGYDTYDTYETWMNDAVHDDVYHETYKHDQTKPDIDNIDHKKQDEPWYRSFTREKLLQHPVNTASRYESEEYNDEMNTIYSRPLRDKDLKKARDMNLSMQGRGGSNEDRYDRSQVSPASYNKDPYSRKFSDEKERRGYFDLPSSYERYVLERPRNSKDDSSRWGVKTSVSGAQPEDVPSIRSYMTSTGEFRPIGVSKQIFTESDRKLYRQHLKNQQKAQGFLNSPTSSYPNSTRYNEQYLLDKKKYPMYSMEVTRNYKNMTSQDDLDEYANYKNQSTYLSHDYCSSSEYSTDVDDGKESSETKKSEHLIIDDIDEKLQYMLGERYKLLSDEDRKLYLKAMKIAQKHNERPIYKLHKKHIMEDYGDMELRPQSRRSSTRVESNVLNADESERHGSRTVSGSGPYELSYPSYGIVKNPQKKTTKKALKHSTLENMPFDKDLMYGGSKLKQTEQDLFEKNNETRMKSSSNKRDIALKKSRRPSFSNLHGTSQNDIAQCIDIIAGQQQLLGQCRLGDDTDESNDDDDYVHDYEHQYALKKRQESYEKVQANLDRQKSLQKHLTYGVPKDTTNYTYMTEKDLESRERRYSNNMHSTDPTMSSNQTLSKSKTKKQETKQQQQQQQQQQQREETISSPLVEKNTKATLDKYTSSVGTRRYTASPPSQEHTVNRSYVNETKKSTSTTTGAKDTIDNEPSIPDLHINSSAPRIDAAQHNSGKSGNKSPRVTPKPASMQYTNTSSLSTPRTVEQMPKQTFSPSMNLSRAQATSPYVSTPSHVRMEDTTTQACPLMYHGRMMKALPEDMTPRAKYTMEQTETPVHDIQEHKKHIRETEEEYEKSKDKTTKSSMEDLNEEEDSSDENVPKRSRIKCTTATHIEKPHLSQKYTHSKPAIDEVSKKSRQSEITDPNELTGLKLKTGQRK